MTISLEKLHIRAGNYHGVLTTDSDAPPALEMILLGKVVGNVNAVKGQASNQWNITANIPADILTDGVQSFAIVPEGEAEVLDSFTIVTGEPLEDDIRAEMTLLRAELDMLKRAFRRHCVETTT